MPIDNVLASVAVKDLDQSVAWYARLLGRPADSTPMPGLAEWGFPGGGRLQVYLLPERAGHGSLTLAVTHIEDLLPPLRALGVDPSSLSSGAKFKTLMFADLDGNHIALAEAHRG